MRGVQDILTLNEFCIIVLDACRYDVFAEVYREYLPPGKLYKIDSGASCTIEWLRETFPGYYDLTYISANGLVIRKKVSLPKFGEYNALKHFKRVVDCFVHGWNDNLGTVLPAHVVNCALLNYDRRMVVHFIQPHAPFVGAKKLLMSEPEMTKLLKKGWLRPETVRLCYVENLRYALRHVRNLVERLNHGVVAITSDHGEFLGENDMVDHPCGRSDAVLREVPLLLL